MPCIAAPEAIWRFSDALKAAAKALAEIPYGECAAFDVWADKHLMGDIEDRADEAEQIANTWLGEIDEADDQRRDNLLEPDFRRLG